MYLILFAHLIAFSLSFLLFLLLLLPAIKITIIIALKVMIEKAIIAISTTIVCMKADLIAASDHQYLFQCFFYHWNYLQNNLYFQH
jgi:hypothetical protein